ncbi:immunity protein 49 of polymorphic toxin system [Pseudomonas sp. SJZ080]|uniref:Imm49 family immunity protein n=1 Tax=Pseudomonas sp. SJZ080 TaxID=2572888 RepID=UPI00119B7DBC|nr:Imm49 family immunity protein [Pseudomonas sp. SJZ080]TWC49164.1 immunity protein 49 of polymorphic toxin system [Pseudomonas sp. SJZ080]
MNLFESYGPGKARAKDRLEHTKSHLDGGFDVEKLIAYIEQSLGNPVACAGRLSSHAFAKGIHAWFETANLEVMKNWFYVSECLHKYQFMLQSDKMNLLPKTLDFMRALVSDNASLIDWFCNCNEIIDEKRIQSTTTADFLAYQIILAVKGDFSQVAERCLQMIAKPPSGPKKIFMLDNDFFMALASGDVLGMESTLTKLTSPASIKKRLDIESGFSEGLISTFGVIYAKIAWCHGYEVRVDTPYIPVEWLPIKPLTNYDPIYSFLK